jgi:threonine synthase
MSIWQWSQLLPEIADEHRISLGEGGTPLILSRHIGPKLGICRLYFKVEAANPTGSYKDRFAASAISHMRNRRQTLCIATSSGNTGSALAAYTAAAGIDCAIAVVEPAPAAKLLQMSAYGARIFRVQGFGIDREITDRTFATMAKFAERDEVALQISAYKYSPLGMAGVESIAFEIANQIGPVDQVFVPAGGGGLTLAVANGFHKLVERRQLSSYPRVHCVQPAGNDTIAGPLRRGVNRAQAVESTTSISGLQVPSVIDGDDVIKACRACGGNGHIVEDADVYAVQRRLAEHEGIFCEPAGAVATAAALAAAARGEIDHDHIIVCLVTGSGFKDLASVERMTATKSYATVKWQELASRLSSQRSD